MFFPSQANQFYLVNLSGKIMAAQTHHADARRNAPHHANAKHDANAVPQRDANANAQRHDKDRDVTMMGQ